MKSWAFLIFLATISLSLSSAAKADIVNIEGLMQGDFVFTATAAGQQIFGAPEGVPLAVRAIGPLTYSINDTGGSTVPFTNLVGQVVGATPPTPPSFLPFYVTPTRFDGGSLTNISRDGLGRIVSGTVVGLASVWEMIGTGPNAGLVLYGDQATTPLVYNGIFNIDYSSGTPRVGLGSTVTGDDPFNVYLYQNGDRVNLIPGTDPRVFVGSNRVKMSVPEPSSLLLGLGAIVGMLVRRKR
jgi:hypothetical protein